MGHVNLEDKYDFEQLYLSYFPKLVRFSKEYVLSEEDAENIAQDVFLLLWEQKEHFSYIQNVPLFLFRLTKNKCIDFLRHKIMSAEKKQRIHEMHNKEFEYRLYSIEQFEESVFEKDEINKIDRDILLYTQQLVMVLPKVSFSFDLLIYQRSKIRL